MPTLSRLLLCLTLVLPQAAIGAGALSEAQARARLTAIEALSRSAPPEALAQLDALKAELPPNASYRLRVDLLINEVWMLEDVGRLEKSYEVQQQVEQLASANHDTNQATIARLRTVRRLLDQNHPEQAQQAMDAIRASLPSALSPEARIAIASSQGDIHTARSQFVKALTVLLEAERLEAPLKLDVERRGNLQNRIAQIYINTDNPQAALETTRRALAMPDLPLRMKGRLQFTRAIALINAERGQEGIATLRLALDSARKTSMSVFEAAVRGNIADYYLRQQDYVTATEEARLALRAAEGGKEQSVVLMARANLGFGLMGQGRMAEGMPYIDGVIAELRQAGSTADVEAMLDEKGRMLERASLYKDALATVRQHQEVQKASSRIARDRAIAALREEYDATERTRQIAQLQRENQLKDADLRNRRLVQILTSFAAVLTVLAGAIVFILYRRAARSNAQLHQLNTQLEFHSMRDALTGLHNRRSFTEKMKARSLRSESERRHDSPASVDCLALLDIDNFKHINDRWGHGVGDTVLVEVARRLTAAVRDSDMVLRWGGEEFMIFAPGAAPTHVAELIGRVLKGIGSAPVEADGAQVPVTVSAGVIMLPLGAEAPAYDWERGIQLADWALYQCKANGRNQARIVSALHAPLATVLSALGKEHGAAAGGMLSLDCVPGPEQRPAAPLAA